MNGDWTPEELAGERPGLPTMEAVLTKQFELRAGDMTVMGMPVEALSREALIGALYWMRDHYERRIEGLRAGLSNIRRRRS